MSSHKLNKLSAASGKQPLVKKLFSAQLIGMCCKTLPGIYYRRPAPSAQTHNHTAMGLKANQIKVDCSLPFCLSEFPPAGRAGTGRCASSSFLPGPYLLCTETQASTSMTVHLIKATLFKATLGKALQIVPWEYLRSRKMASTTSSFLPLILGSFRTFQGKKFQVG